MLKKNNDWANEGLEGLPVRRATRTINSYIVSLKDFSMLDSDTPLIEDFNAAIRYCVMVRDQLLTFRDVEIPEALQVVTMWGIRHAERTAADAVHRMLRCVAADVDGAAPEAFDALLEQLKAPGSKRPAFLSDRSLQQILFLRNIAMAAGLPIITANPKEELDTALHGAKVAYRLISLLIKEFEQMRDWCAQNLDPA